MTHFEVLGLGLEGQFLGLDLGLKASSPQKLPCLSSRTALFFEWLKFCRSAEKKIFRPFFWRSGEKNF